MNKLLVELLSNNIKLSEFVEKLPNSSSILESDIHNLLDSYNDEDRTAIAYLCLYYISKINFKIKKPFIMFLDSIEDEIDNDFSQEIKFHHLVDNIIIFQIDHLYFIINNSIERIKVNLPNSLQNDYRFCVNCNHEIYFEDALLLEPYEFYIVSDIK